MNFLRSIYIRPRFFALWLALTFLFALSFVWPDVYTLARIAAILLTLSLVIDVALLYGRTAALASERECPEKFSNGDVNPIVIKIKSNYTFEVSLEIIDEIPVQFQKRDFSIQSTLKPQEKKQISYQLRPNVRGEYHFGSLNIYAWSALGLAMRRFRFDEAKMVSVYPSFLQMRQYEFMAISNNLSAIGVKKIRKLGHNMEFEQVKEYVQGDDIRSINWKASARKGDLMVNQYQDERSQAVYCLVDKGRSMQLPFEGLTLLDHAINASLVLLNIALLKQDKAGLISFDHQIGSSLKARGGKTQIRTILDILYREETNFTESDFSTLSAHVRRQIKQRSLLIIFTNFEAESSMLRQLPFLRQLAKYHLVLLVLFENTEIGQLIEKPALSTEEIYIQTIAEQFKHNKKLIVRELNQYGIHTLLSRPQDLSANTINQYLEFKSRGLI